jgi:hypothetical protein
MRRLALIAALVGVAFAVAPGAGSAFSCGVSLDRFNRANSADLGSNWAIRSSSIGIDSQVATNADTTTALATFKPRGAHEACVDVAASGPGAQSVAIVLRYANLDDNVLIKVVSNDGSSFDSAYYYRGNSFHPLRSGSKLRKFSHGRIHVWSKGTRARLDIDTNSDNKPEQSFTVKGIKAAGLGSKIGLGIYGGATADNFATAPPQTKITKHPGKTTSGHTARFKFKSSIGGSHFKCKLDGQRYKKCSSPKTYRGLSAGKHKFRVKAIDRFGNPDPTPAKFGWRIT